MYKNDGASIRVAVFCSSPNYMEYWPASFRHTEAPWHCYYRTSTASLVIHTCTCFRHKVTCNKIKC